MPELRCCFRLECGLQSEMAGEAKHSSCRMSWVVGLGRDPANEWLLPPPSCSDRTRAPRGQSRERETEAAARKAALYPSLHPPEPQPAPPNLRWKWEREEQTNQRCGEGGGVWDAACQPLCILLSKWRSKKRPTQKQKWRLRLPWQMRSRPSTTWIFFALGFFGSCALPLPSPL